ncbi:gtp cyclohydrolase i [Stylonychia lemnae]|uniref:GTP cyclohydrolase 1 n=1 Tax=Stylonychia lemnae TaxID=5949 RepID=A0A078B0L4_STYLE|nr:gtp cyclohydrolase i [Stylonychia lemnae]|eukprot:CDW86648.1 gtp cyclohydrolase i [Stylonychia lemnae]
MELQTIVPLNNPIDQRGDQLEQLVRQMLIDQRIQTPINSMNVLTNVEKTSKITELVQQIMETLGLDLNDESLRDTPKRVAKMYVNELFQGLSPESFPNCTTFDIKEISNVTQTNIPFTSMCEHHLMPFFGVAHISYQSNGRVIGLSKLNRVVNYFARRPQVQERLTKQIHRALQLVLQSRDVRVIIEAEHFCIQARGVQQKGSKTLTEETSGMYSNSKFIQKL